MRVWFKKERIDFLKQKRDRLNNSIKVFEDMKKEWYDSGVSSEDMERIRRTIRKIIYQRDECDDELDVLSEVRNLIYISRFIIL